MTDFGKKCNVNQKNSKKVKTVKCLNESLKNNLNILKIITCLENDNIYFMN